MIFKLFYSLLTAFLALGLFSVAHAQEAGFVSIDEIKEIKEVKQAEQEVRSLVEGWKLELESMQQQIDNLKSDLNDNRLKLSDEERAIKNEQLTKLIQERKNFTKAKFEPGGEYDVAVNQIMAPAEEKIYLHFLMNEKD